MATNERSSMQHTRGRLTVASNFGRNRNYAADGESDDSNNDELQAGGLDGYLVTAALAFLLGALFVLCVAYGFHRHRRRNATHNIAKSTSGHYKSMERLEDHENGSDPNKSSTPYFVIDSKNDDMRRTERPTNLIHGITEDKSRPEYTPLTPCSIDDKDFTLKEESIRVESPRVAENGDEGCRTVAVDNDVSVPLIERSKETDLIDDIKAAISAAALQKQAISIPFADDSVEPLTATHESVDPPKVVFNQSGTEADEPPTLPPKQSSLKNKNLLPPLPLPESPSIPRSSVNTNSNNNHKGSHRSPPIVDLPPPPPPVPIQQELSGEIFQTKTLPKSLPKKPPPPRPKAGLKKHETFSAPHNQKIKPPVPPKSNSVMRSSSMRLPSSPVMGDLPSPRSDVVASSSSPFSGDKDFHSLGKGSLIRPGRTPSYKHHSMSRPRSKGLVAVAPPVVPSLE